MTKSSGYARGYGGSMPSRYYDVRSAEAVARVSSPYLRRLLAAAAKMERNLYTHSMKPTVTRRRMAKADLPKVPIGGEEPGDELAFPAALPYAFLRRSRAIGGLIADVAEEDDPTDFGRDDLTRLLSEPTADVIRVSIPNRSIAGEDPMSLAYGPLKAYGRNHVERLGELLDKDFSVYLFFYSHPTVRMVNCYAHALSVFDALTRIGADTNYVTKDSFVELTLKGVDEGLPIDFVAEGIAAAAGLERREFDERMRTRKGRSSGKVMKWFESPESSRSD